MSTLLGPDGRPISGSKYQNKKAPPPALGDAFGAWAGRDREFFEMPGGGLVQFDLSKLTLDDYRQMKDHYQVNASLSVLSFMQHQSDWRIECEDQRIADFCEEQIRNNWTGLNRAMSQSNWAGYSPSVLQWKNEGRNIALDKIKDLVPEECAVQWKKVDGYAPPGRIAPKLNVYDGIKQFGMPYPIPVENSFWFPLLMENGDYYGRKLLRPAFTSYFFSILVHLFSNRYYERFGEPVPIGRAPFEDDIEIAGKSVPGNEYMLQILQDLRNRSVVVLPHDKSQHGREQTLDFDYDIEYLECVDTETEILTQDGWKRYNEVLEGDETLTLNHDTGLSEWQPIQKMNVYEVENREMLKMEGTAHSSLTTLGHRWPVLKKHVPQKTAPNGLQVSYDSREWRESKDIKQADRIPLIAPQANLPTAAKYNDDFVALVAWYWTEGYTFATGNYILISQKRYPELIRASLTRLFGAPVNKFANSVGSTVTSGVPMWRENGKASDPDNRQFFLNYQATELLHEVAPDRIVTYEFLRSLTASQLGLYIDTALKADGNRTARQSFLMQKDYRKAEMFQFACILAGYATSLYHLKSDKRFPNDTGMWVTSIRRSEFLHPKNAARGNGPFSMTREEYTGVVWCPTTQNQSWLARRRGTVYFTGNSQMRGADFERYLTRLDEEISIGLFTPILLLRTADVGSYNLGTSHMQTYLWMMNAMNDDRKIYIDKYILSKMADYNFGPNAPRPKIAFRKLGNLGAEMIKELLTALTQRNKIKFDYRELGQIAGMTIEEIEENSDDEPVPTPETPPTPEPPGSGDDDGDTATQRASVAIAAPNSGNARAVGKEIVRRVSAQVERARSDSEFTSELRIAMGYKRKMEQAYAKDGASLPAVSANNLYGQMDQWLKDVLTFANEFVSTESFMTLFESTLMSRIDEHGK